MTLDADPIESIKEILPLAESFCKSVLHHLKTTTNLQEVPITVKKQLDFDEKTIFEVLGDFSYELGFDACIEIGSGCTDKRNLWCRASLYDQ